MKLANLTDIHTHHTGRKEALLSLPADVALLGCDTPFSLELHPWRLERDEGKGIKEKEFLEVAQRLAGNPNLLAIGECGLDNQCGVPLELQLTAFKTALQVAQEMHLPVIIHCVGYWAEMMACVKELYPLPTGEEWGGAIIHGYRKGPQLAEQLLKAGFQISLGEKFNPEVARLIPQERLFFETDESNTDILTIREKIVSLRGNYTKKDEI